MKIEIDKKDGVTRVTLCTDTKKKPEVLELSDAELQAFVKIAETALKADSFFLSFSES